MNVSLLLSIVMLVVGVVFLVLSFLHPNEIQIGAFVVSLLISLFFICNIEGGHEWNRRF